MEKTLLKMGYGKNVINDEIQAYLSTANKTSKVENKKWKLSDEFRKVFRDRNKKD